LIPIDAAVNPMPANKPDKTAVFKSGFGPSNIANAKADTSVRIKVMP